jgi:hypothetical protein
VRAHESVLEEAPAPQTKSPEGASTETQKLRIAQISNLVEPVTDSSTNGLAQIVYNLTEELVDWATR